MSENCLVKAVSLAEINISTPVIFHHMLLREGYILMCNFLLLDAEKKGLGVNIQGTVF